MCNDQHGDASERRRAKQGGDESLAHGVDGGAGLVKQQHFCIRQQKKDNNNNALLNLGRLGRREHGPAHAQKRRAAAVRQRAARSCASDRAAPVPPGAAPWRAAPRSARLADPAPSAPSPEAPATIASPPPPPRAALRIFRVTDKQNNTTNAKPRNDTSSMLCPSRYTLPEKLKRTIKKTRPIFSLSLKHSQQHSTQCALP
jgi:hypothetical protein